MSPNGPAEAADHAPPLLRVVRGAPSAEELAALVAVVTAMAAAPVAAPPRGLRRWADRSRMVRRPLEHGQGAWRASALPR